ncbi:hypothetical protein ACSBR1_034875 [Camellia fascicularis]
MEDCEKKVTVTEKDPSPRSIVQGEGSSSHDQPVAITNEVTVVIDSHLKPPPPPPPPPPIRDEFQNSIKNEGGESSESGESSNNTKPEHKVQRAPPDASADEDQEILRSAAGFHRSLPPQ